MWSSFGEKPKLVNLVLQLYISKRDLNLRDISASWRVVTQLDGLLLILSNLKEHLRKAMRECNFVKVGEMKIDFEQKSAPAVLWSNVNESECQTFQPDCFPKLWVSLSQKVALIGEPSHVLYYLSVFTSV